MSGVGNVWSARVDIVQWPRGCADTWAGGVSLVGLGADGNTSLSSLASTTSSCLHAVRDQKADSWKTEGREVSCEVALTDWDDGGDNDLQWSCGFATCLACLQND